MALLVLLWAKKGIDPMGTSRLRPHARRLGKAFLSLALALLIALSPLLTGCYGSFPLTKFVYRLNGSVTPAKPMHQIVFWLFLVLPVYNFALLGDAVVFNLIEFWTGARLGGGSARAEDGTVYALEPSADQREAVLSITRDGAPPRRIRFTRTSANTLEVRDSQGRLVGRVARTPQGGFDLADADGRTLQRIAPEELASARPR